MAKFLVAILCLAGCGNPIGPETFVPDLGACGDVGNCGTCLSLTGCHWTGGKCQTSCMDDSYCYGSGSPGATSCPAPGEECVLDEDCGVTASRCAYKISDGCGAKGVCFSPADGPMCGALTETCGCDGSRVVSGCTYPQGYASAPTTGLSFCTDGGV